MATNGFGGVPITTVVEDAQRRVKDGHADERIAAATLLVMLDMRRLLDRLDTGLDLVNDSLKRVEAAIRDE